MARFHSDMDALEMRPPIAEPRATESIDRDHRARRPAARLRARVPHARHRVLRRLDVPALRRAVALLRGRRWSRLARARGGNPDDPHRRDPLDFVLWQPSLRRRARVARAVRRRPARAGTSSARRWRCTSTARRSTCTAAAPTSSSRTTSARSRRARALTGEPFVAPLDALGDGQLRGREDVEVARQPRVRRATC